jgi:hypothetical protein
MVEKTGKSKVHQTEPEKQLPLTLSYDAAIEEHAAGHAQRVASERPGFDAHTERGRGSSLRFWVSVPGNNRIFLSSAPGPENTDEGEASAGKANDNAQ